MESDRNIPNADHGRQTTNDAQDRTPNYDETDKGSGMGGTYSGSQGMEGDDKRNGERPDSPPGTEDDWAASGKDSGGSKDNREPSE